jgi:(p)ppGpp synthase/HD superfamily hydrolase
LKVFSSDRSGILADILNTISRGGFIIKEAKIKSIGSGKSECSFVFVPRKLEEVINLIERVKKVRGVERIYFE